MILFSVALALRFRKLPGQRGFEGFLELVHVSLVALGIDERIRISCPPRRQLGVLLGETVKRGVRTEENVCAPRTVSPLCGEVYIILTATDIFPCCEICCLGRRA